MTDLELWYRLLLRAYPAGHRARTDDEMLSTLLDVAGPTQRRPTIREAAALVATGTIERLRTAGELAHGVRLAGIVALAFVVAAFMVAVRLGVSDITGNGAVPLAIWLVTAGAVAFGTWSDRVYRVLPAGLMAVILVVGGPALAGFRRSVTLPLALLLLGAVCSRAGARWGVLAAGVPGLLWSALVVDFQSYGLRLGRWDYASTVFWANPNWLMAALALLLVAGLARTRLAVAAMLLLGPLAILGMIRPGQFLLPASALIALAAIVGTAAPWLSGGRTSHTGGRV